ncbi:hypothetical protein Agub_g8512 [Astrephomene gubernaculifera]|uniref:phosphoribosylaminoimidazole carboxylase n=1 Tax=Astrephomene gubernaculifera TaxID=47775 RepID=A0AAD3DRT8_9CHLO|nr:hypothetical protein Agub_g8512 [Astrephomene gubernaculifera]
MLLSGKNVRLNRHTTEVASLQAPAPQPTIRRTPAVKRQRSAPATRRMATVQATAAPIAERDATSVSETGLPRTAVVGVLGGGQLGRMMALAAANLGVRVKCLDPAPEAPAAVAAEHVRGHFRDAAAIEDFVKGQGIDVLTMEIEHVNTDALEQAARDVQVDIEPSPATIRTIQDKFDQKRHFAAAGVPLPAFREVRCGGCMEATAGAFGYPFMLKARRLAYDGRGNYLVRGPGELEGAVAALGGYEAGLYAEQFAPFVKELAVMVVRSRDGRVVSYPVVETLHKDNICHVTEAPAEVPPAIREAARRVAERAVGCLQGAGIFGVEMFLLPDGSLLLNEVAPRPHNSGHYTMDGCVTSQFENHVRAVLGWPLGETRLHGGSVAAAAAASNGNGNGNGACCSAASNGVAAAEVEEEGEEGSCVAIMLNLLGEADGEEGVRRAHEVMGAAYDTPGCKVHWYGKEGMKVGRKVGHINILATSRREARERLGRLDPAAAAALQRTSQAAAAAGLLQSQGQGHAAAAVQQQQQGTGVVAGAAACSAGPVAAEGAAAAAEGAGEARRPLVGIIMGSDSDLATMKAAAQVLEEFGVPLELTVVSAHRTPERMMDYARSAASRGLRVIIAGAGGAAHLPGMVAAMTALPVVGVPVKPSGAHLDGLDALLSIVQMPRGVPVATVAIGNAANAGLLAVRILGAADPELRARMEAYQEGMRESVLGKAERLEQQGWANYKA